MPVSDNLPKPNCCLIIASRPFTLVLTFYLRRERFCEGICAEVVKEGDIKLVLERLAEIKDILEQH